MEKLKRLWKHLLIPPRTTRRIFPQESCSKIAEASRVSESRHSGDVRVAIESSLTPTRVIRGQTTRERAIEVFSLFRVWDTEDNDGVLIYLLLAERQIEIVADRGINKKVEQEFWDGICSELGDHFQQGNFCEGLLQGIEKITLELGRHFPSTDTDRNELRDTPILLD